MPKNFIMVDIFQECLLLSKIPGKRRISAADMTGWYAKNEGSKAIWKRLLISQVLMFFTGILLPVSESTIRPMI